MSHRSDWLSVLQPMPADPASASGFWSHVDCSVGPRACWPFRSPRDPDGYGIFTWQGPTPRPTSRHRLGNPNPNRISGASTGV